jgi:hypothetical protein
MKIAVQKKNLSVEKITNKEKYIVKLFEKNCLFFLTPAQKINTKLFFIQFQKIQKYIKNTIRMIAPTAPLTYKDFLFNWVALFLYFCDNIDKF